MASSKELESIVQESEPMTATITHDAKAPGSGKPNITSEDEKFSFIMQGIREKPSNGNRNNFVHVVASDCNRFGLSESYTLHQLCQYAEKGFDEKEIKQAVSSAYQRIGEHGTKEYKKHPTRSNQKTPAPYTTENKKNKTLSDFEPLRITEKSDIPEPEPILMLAGEIIAVNGDIFTISGASKSGKSAVCGMAIAATLTASGICPDAIETLQMKPNPEKNAILHFDTEQAAHKHKSNLLSVLRRAGIAHCPDHLLSYNIRKLALNEYQIITENICKAASASLGGIHSIWIDGGADYVADVNDQAASNQIVKYFEDLAIRYNTAVFLIVHTNPGGDKERGHFGSQCQRKSGGILTVKQEGDVSFVEAKILRYAGKGDIQKLSFIYDKEKGYHIGCGIKIEVDPELKRREKKINEAQEICDQIFSGQRSYQYKDALSAIAKITLKSERTNKDIFTIMNNQNMIENNKSNGFWRKK